jgi:YgiT-type zinc finger domain-containing protein
MSNTKKTTGFWAGETCEYCGGPIIEKQVTVYRKVKDQYMLFENVPAGVCKQCGTRYYAANVLKLIEEGVHGRQKVAREVLVPVYSFS